MTQQQPSNHIPEAKKMVPGDELHLALLMAPYSLNFFTGHDRQHLLAFGRAAFEAGQAAAQQAVQAVQAVQAKVPEGWKRVPIEPTAAMVEAIMSEGEVDAINRLAPCLRPIFLERAGIVSRYTAMLAAAPAHPAEGVPAQEVQAAIDRFDAYFRSANGVPPNARVSVPTAEWQELRAMLSTHPTQQGMDDLHKQMLKALESVGAHTVTDCDGDEITAYFCNWQAISDAKRAAQAKQGGAA